MNENTYQQPKDIYTTKEEIIGQKEISPQKGTNNDLETDKIYSNNETAIKAFVQSIAYSQKQPIISQNTTASSPPPQIRIEEVHLNHHHTLPTRLPSPPPNEETFGLVIENQSSTPRQRGIVDHSEDQIHQTITSSYDKRGPYLNQMRVSQESIMRMSMQMQNKEKEETLRDKENSDQGFFKPEKTMNLQEI